MNEEERIKALHEEYFQKYIKPQFEREFKLAGGVGTIIYRIDYKTNRKGEIIDVIIKHAPEKHSNATEL